MLWANAGLQQGMEQNIRFSMLVSRNMVHLPLLFDLLCGILQTGTSPQCHGIRCIALEMLSYVLFYHMYEMTCTLRHVNHHLMSHISPDVRCHDKSLQQCKAPIICSLLISSELQKLCCSGLQHCNPVLSAFSGYSRLCDVQN